MQLQEIDTIQDLKVWVEENMPGARLTEDSAGDIVIHTGLGAAMGGYLHPIERGRVMDKIICNACKNEIITAEWWNISKDYEGNYLCDDCDMSLQLKEREGE